MIQQAGGNENAILLQPAESAEPLIKEGGVKVAQTPRGIAVEINVASSFASAQADRQAQSITVLQQVGATTGAGLDNPILVEGHTDPLPINSFRFPFHWELSALSRQQCGQVVLLMGVWAEWMMAVACRYQTDCRESDGGWPVAQSSGDHRYPSRTNKEIVELPEMKRRPLASGRES